MICLFQHVPCLLEIILNDILHFPLRTFNLDIFNSLPDFIKWFQDRTYFPSTDFCMLLEDQVSGDHVSRSAGPTVITTSQLGRSVVSNCINSEKGPSIRWLISKGLCYGSVVLPKSPSSLRHPFNL
ncbi:hypothetical protein Golax_015139, partial [Gossypium laxum]|nr:hypothetical protein [Gossypium laxum]